EVLETSEVLAALWSGVAQQRQANHKLAALSQASTEGLHDALVHLDHAPNQRQADTQTSLRAIQRSIDLSEQLEDLGEHVRRNPDTGVSNAKDQLFQLSFHLQLNLAAGFVVLVGLFDCVCRCFVQ